jgi:hypothetical protein
LKPGGFKLRVSWILLYRVHCGQTVSPTAAGLGGAALDAVREVMHVRRDVDDPALDPPGVALQVEFERQTLKPVFSLYRL